ncbi:MAG: DEAD/DEAH box helicase [Rhodospirillales bacterium]|nr:DEAD/DEAH box helicase [Rhodospirillales bacterium]
MDEDYALSFQELDLDSSLLRAVEASGFRSPTEVQSQVIPLVLEGRDVMASAQTGTGKTAAFVLPALQRLLIPSKSRGRGPRVLVLTPTRELANQINESIRQLGRFTRCSVATVVGGVAYPPQQQLLGKPLDVLVATPGRLLDHMERGRVDFSRLEVLVLDEADRMLDMGFIEDVERIAAATPAGRQSLLFSATLEGDIRRIAQRLLRDPVRVQISGIKERHSLIEQRVHRFDDTKHKHALLDHLLQDTKVYQAIIFTATKRGAENLAGTLEADGHAAAALHGDMRQSARNRTVERLRRGKLRVLVATDVAARGLDIKDISHVINFDLPMVAQDYIHRIGRTGRAGVTGTAISLVGPGDGIKLGRIERLTGQSLDRQVIPGLEPTGPEPGARKPKPLHRGQNGPRGRTGSDAISKHRPHGKNVGYRPSRPGRTSGRPSGMRG